MSSKQQQQNNMSSIKYHKNEMEKKKHEKWIKRIMAELKIQSDLNNIITQY